ncbi:hypothetical protein D3C85_1521970 [compost metagenome]
MRLHQDVERLLIILLPVAGAHWLDAAVIDGEGNAVELRIANLNGVGPIHFGLKVLEFVGNVDLVASQNATAHVRHDCSVSFDWKSGQGSCEQGKKAKFHSQYIGWI